MLVIGRKFGEKITIGSDITIQVVSLGKGRVGIGIEAPKTLRIERVQQQVSSDAKESANDKPH